MRNFLKIYHFGTILIYRWKNTILPPKTFGKINKLIFEGVIYEKIVNEMAEKAIFIIKSRFAGENFRFHKQPKIAVFSLFYVWSDSLLAFT